MVKNLSTIDRSEKIRLGKNTSDYQPENTIVLNATSEIFPSLTANSFYVAPLRYDFDQRATSNTIVYNFVTKEIVDIGPGSRVSLEDVLITGNVTANTAEFNNTFTGLVTLSNVGIGNANPIHLLDVGNNFYINRGGDVWIGGELFVAGNTSTINTQNLTIKDPIIEIARNNPGINDIGVMMTRTVAGSNVAMIYKEGSDQLSFGYTASNATDQNVVLNASNPLDVKVYGDLYTTGNTNVGAWTFHETQTPVQTVVYGSSNVNVVSPVTGVLNMTIQSTQLGFGNELEVTLNGTRIGIVNDASPGPVVITENIVKGDVLVIDTNFGFGFLITNYYISYINTVFSLISYDRTNTFTIYDATKVGILQDIPTHTLDVGSNLYVQDSGTSNVLGVTGNTYVSGDVTIRGNASFSNNLHVTKSIVSLANINVGNDLTVTGNAFMSSNVVVSGNTDVQSDLNVTGNVFVSSNVIVSGNTDVRSNLNIDGNAHVHSELNVDGNVFVSSNIVVTGNTDMRSELNVDGNVFVASNIVVTGNTDMRSELNVDGNVFVASNIIVSGNTDIRSELNVDGNAYMHSELNVDGNIFVSSNLVVTGNTDVQSELNVDGNIFVSGNTDISSELNVTGNVFVASNIVVTGNTDMRSELNVDGNVFVASNIIVSGNTDIQSELNVDGNVFVSGNTDVLSELNVSGNVDVQSNLVVHGNTEIQSNLTVGGNTDVLSELNVSGNVDVQSNLVVHGNTEIQSNLTVSGNTDISSELNVAGNVFVTSNIIVTGNTDIRSELNVDGNVFVSSNAVITGNVDVSKQVNVTGNIYARSNVDVSEQLNVIGNVYASSNIMVTGNVHAARYYGDGGHLANVTLQVVSDHGNATSNTIRFTNPTTALTTDLTSNVGVNIGQLNNVTLTTPLNEDMLVYDGSNWVNQKQNHLFLSAKANVALTKGDVVYATRALGNDTFIVDKADARDPAKMPALGIVYQDLAQNAQGLIVTFGRADSVPLDSFKEGETVYVSNTVPGGLSNLVPHGEVNGVPNLIQNIGLVVKPHVSQGIVSVTGVGRTNAIPNANVITQTPAYVYTDGSTNQNTLHKIVPANLLTKLQTLEQVVNTGNTVANTINLTGLTTTGNVAIGSNVSITGLTDPVNKYLPMVDTDGTLIKSPVLVNENGKYVITASEAEFLGNITLSGNTTIISSTSVTIGDRIFGVGANNSATNLDTGFMIEHQDGNTYANVALIYHALDHKFTIGYTQNTFTDDHILNFTDSNHVMLFEIDGNALVQNNLTVNHGIISGDGGGISNVTLQQITQYGNTTANTIEFTNTISIVTTGNVGIANTLASHTMDIGSNVYIDDTGSNVIHAIGNVYATRFIGDGSFLENIASNLELIVTNGNVASRTMSLLNTDVSLSTLGPVGIANTEPGHTLSVASNVYFSDTGSNVIHASGNVYATRFIGDGSFLENIASNLEQIALNGNVTSQTISIDNQSLSLITSGSVGIANVSPAHTLSVGSNVYVSDTGSNVLVIEGNVLAQKITLGNVSITPAYTLQQITATSNITYHTVEFNNTDTSLVTASNVGIATTSPSYTLEVNGTAAKTGGGTWTSTSDARLKENIEDANLETCYDTIKNLKLRRFKWRDDVEGITDKNVIGWIAQEVEEVIPKAVNTVDEKYGLTDVKFLNADQIYASMFGAIQKLIEDKERLEARVAELMKK